MDRGGSIRAFQNIVRIDSLPSGKFSIHQAQLLVWIPTTVPYPAIHIPGDPVERVRRPNPLGFDGENGLTELGADRLISIKGEDVVVTALIEGKVFLFDISGKIPFDNTCPHVATDGSGIILGVGVHHQNFIGKKTHRVYRAANVRLLIESDNGNGNFDVGRTNPGCFGHNAHMDQMVTNRIVLVKNRGMGDSIMGLSALSYMRRLFPDKFIAYAIPAWICPLYSVVETDADEIWPLDLNGLKGWVKSWEQFKGVDIIYEMFQSGRTGTFFRWHRRLNRGSYFYHNHHLKEGPVFRQGNVMLPAIQRDLDGIWTFFAKEREWPVPDYRKFVPRMRLHKSISQRENIIILGVVATVDTKIWSLNNYCLLAKSIRKYFPHWRIVIPLAFSDTECEKELLKLGLPDGVEIMKKELSLLPAFFASAKLYVGNDTGIKHLAVAMGVKTYTLLGPIPPDEFHPYDWNEHPYFFIEDMECRTVSAHFCGLSFCDHKSCLENIGVEEVFERISEDLE